MADSSASKAEDFLVAEEAAQYLADSLKRLDKEANKYSSAGTTLSEAGERVRALADRVGEVATRATEAIEVLRGAGAAQVIDRLDALQQELQTQLKSLSDLAATNQEQRRQSEVQLLERMEAGLREVGEATSALKGAHSASFQEIAGEVRTGFDELKAAESATSEHLKVAGDTWRAELRESMTQISDVHVERSRELETAIESAADRAEAAADSARAMAQRAVVASVIAIIVGVACLVALGSRFQ